MVTLITAKNPIFYCGYFPIAALPGLPVSSLKVVSFSGLDIPGILNFDLTLCLTQT